MKMKYNSCNGKCIQNGLQSNGSQRYKCCICRKKQQSDYVYNAYKKIEPRDNFVCQGRFRNKQYG